MGPIEQPTDQAISQAIDYSIHEPVYVTLYQCSTRVTTYQSVKLSGCHAIRERLRVTLLDMEGGHRGLGDLGATGQERSSHLYQ